MTTRFIVEEIPEELREEGLLGSVEITETGIIIRGDIHLIENQKLIRQAIEVSEKAREELLK